jgi:hypothetical protein
MADDKQPGSGVGGSVILLVAAAASAVYVGWRSPLVSTRPAVSDYEINQTMPAQDIDARLWQDPFGAVGRAIEAKRNGKVDPAAGHCLDDFRSLLSPSDPTLLIGVALPGDPYPEADETRRRLRYAVLSALHVAQYTPVDERHIGYFLTNEKPAPGDNAKQETVASGLRLHVAQAVGHSQRSAHSRFFRVAARARDDPPADGIGTSRAATNCAVKAEETGDNDKPSIPAVVPFEEYEKTNWDKYDGTNGRKLDATNGHKRIFVLWLDEEALAHRKPIASLAGLLCGLKLFDHKNEKFVFVGPQDSNTLRDMVAEINSKPLRECPPEMLVSPGNKLSAPTPASSQAPLDKSNNEQLRTPLANDDLLTVYNFGATAEDKIILKNAGFDPQTDLHDLFLGAGVSYYRTISSDEALADVLARELQRRGIDLCPEWEPLDPRASEDSRCRHLHHDRVFLLSEWDTAYGRYLPETVSDVFGADDSSFGDCRLNTRHGIMHASYLRGLDGRFPSRRPSKDEKPAADDATATRTMSDDTNGGQPTAATPETAQRYETAEGQSQYDYLRRITRLLKECDDKLRLQAKGKVAAIGVLGSDVYDKLLLLQALRPEFPEALFFTTDLDELLLPQGKLRYTRNLLVASGFGLTLAPDLQRDVLPFRSTYQTAVFLATRLAIRNGDLIKPPTEQENEPKTVKANDPKIEPRWADTAVAVRCWSKQPLLFQIGRTVPRGLPIDPIAGKFDACKDLGKDPKADFVNYSTIQPEVPRLYQNFSGSARWGVFLLVIPILVTLLSLRPIRKVFKPEDALSGVEPADRVVPSSIWLTPLAVVALIVWALVTLRWPMTACWLTEYPNGEPITLFEGISVWPTIASRVFGTILSLFLIWYTLRVLAINLQETKDKMAIPPSEEVAAPSKLFSRLWFPPQSSYTILDYDYTGRPKVAFRDIVNESSLNPGSAACAPRSAPL